MDCQPVSRYSTVTVFGSGILLVCGAAVQKKFFSRGFDEFKA